MPDPRWPPAEPLLAYFICAIDWADAEFENIAAHNSHYQQHLSATTAADTTLTEILFPGQSSQMEEYMNELHEWSYANNM